MGLLGGGEGKGECRKVFLIVCCRARGERAVFRWPFANEGCWSILQSVIAESPKVAVADQKEILHSLRAELYFPYYQRFAPLLEKVQSVIAEFQDG